MDGLFVVGVLCFNHHLVMKSMRKTDHSHPLFLRNSLCVKSEAE